MYIYNQLQWQCCNTSSLMELIVTTLLLLLLLPFTHSSCNHDRSVLASAFANVGNFQSPDCSSNVDMGLQQLILPSRNLTGTVSWNLLSAVPSLRVVDLSDNLLHGSVPSGFWASPNPLLDVNLANNRLGGALRFAHSNSLNKLNLSGNRFTNIAEGLSGLSGLRSLDVSRNALRFVPAGLHELRELTYLDVSCNSMEGEFYQVLGHVLPRLSFLNVSYNNFSGKVESGTTNKFGKSAFLNAGSLTFTSAAASAADISSSSTNDKKKKKKKKKHKHDSVRRRTRVNRLLVLIVAAPIAIGLMTIVGSGAFFVFVIKKRRRRRRERGRKEEERGVKAAEEVPAWVAEANWTAPVVVFEKPLMELRFSDLAAATSWFGRESQLAEGRRSGSAYRAVLPGDMNVVVRVAEGAREAEEHEVAAGFREMAKFRHPNLLPLLGYCIAGKEKLLLYEYMERGDLHRWLHELPTGHPDVEDWCADAWEPQQCSTDKRTTSSSTMSEDWPTRHRIALGIARGLAFLHQGWAGSTSGRPVVHGHLVPSNVLLGDDLEPRIADIATYRDVRGARGTPEGDVCAFGVLVMELVTGRGGRWSMEEVEKVRKSVKEGKGAQVLDCRVRMEVDGSGVVKKWEEREMVECLRVGYLCTAQSPEKRPTMQQVVGLLKDIRHRPTSSSAAATTSLGLN